VDGALKGFLTEVAAWTADPGYFEQFATTVTYPVYTYRRVCENDPDEERICYVERIVIGYRTVTTWSNASRAARIFSEQFGVADGAIDPDVTLGSERAQNLSEVLEGVPGIEPLNGRLETSCTGTFAYDSETDIHCNSSTLIGGLLQTLVSCIVPAAVAGEPENADPIATQLPNPTDGIQTYGNKTFPDDFADSVTGDTSCRAGQYGTAKTVASLTKLGEAWKEKYPEGPPIYIGDISRRGGGNGPKTKKVSGGTADIEMARRSTFDRFTRRDRTNR